MVASLHKVIFNCIYSYISYFTICIYYLFVILHLHMRIKYQKLNQVGKVEYYLGIYDFAGQCLSPT